MERFDRELRSDPEWADWRSNGNYKYALVQDGRVYPVKQIIRMATGFRDFTGGDEANSYLRARGFHVTELNAIRDGLDEVLNGYVQAKAGEFGKASPMWEVFNRLTRAINSSAPVAKSSTLDVTWGAGQGQWARIPWVAVLDSRETDTTQHGVYCVYLFRQDMSGVYLTLNQGVTEFKNLNSEARRRELSGRARRLRDRCADLRQAGFALDSQIDLRVEQGIGADYEASTVAYKLYERGRVPPDSVLLSDLEHVLQAYLAHVEGTPSERASHETLELDEEALNVYREQFLNRMPGFRSFQDSGARYRDWERGYKDELVSLFRQSLNEAAFRGDSLQVGSEINQRLVALLLKALPSNRHVQNLVSWRYTSFLKELTPEQRTSFATQLYRLLYGDGGAPQRLERFNEYFPQLLAEVSDDSPVPATRTFPTLLLMLANPQVDVIVRSDLTSRVGKALLGRKLLKSGPMDAAQYQEWLRLTNAVKQKLVAWGWDPQDQLDVQTFLWVASSDSYGEENAQPGDNGEDEEEDDKTQRGTADLQAVHSDFAGAIQQANLDFGAAHEQLTRSFVASLATKRFVILTGLSGSGKTQIALKFGQWLGPGRYLLVPVRPDWTGAEALFGYEDALAPVEGGRRAWQVPQALEFMLKALNDPDHPYLLILDEMNLAHVERYFADALSGMESREACLPNLSRERDGHWRIPDGQPPRLTVPKNLFVVGTVNVDETTYLFSPKVLDRANTFEFRVRTEDLSASAGRPTSCAPGPAALVKGFLQIAQNDKWHTVHPASGLDIFTTHLRALHGILSEGSFEFGHRVFYEATRFSALLAGAGDADPLRALDLQVLQKILPRLHGSRKRLERTLRRVARFCYDLGLEAGDAQGGVGESVFDPLNPLAAAPQLPQSFDKARRMMAALRANQFTSFTE
jgi:5-methylcytosine-specific restriction protein B